MPDEYLVPVERIEHRVYVIRGQRVILDQDLASLYGVTTKSLNQQILRNIGRFPDDFSFRLSHKEWEILKSQIVTSKKGSGGKQKLPRVFTEYGAYGAAFVLRSAHAEQMSVAVVRAFAHMKNFLVSQQNLLKDVQELKSFVLKHSHKSDQEFRRVWKAIEKLSAPAGDARRIGFSLD